MTEAREKEAMSGASQAPPMPVLSEKQPVGASTTSAQVAASEAQTQEHPTPVPAAHAESKEVAVPSTAGEPKQTAPTTSMEERTGPSPT
jgi:Mrp family chromosome partitioning ATPase